MTAMTIFCFFAAINLFAACCLRPAYPVGTMAVLLFFLSLQLATAFSAAVIPALALAFLLGLIAAVANSLAEALSARGVVVMGLSLAATQIANPLGALLAAMFAPLFTLRMPDAARGKNAGLLLLLLFIPAITALVLAYLARTAHFDPFPHLAGSFDRAIQPLLFSHMAPRAKGIVEALVVTVLALPVWLAALRSGGVVATVLVASTLVAAILIAALFGHAHSLGVFLPSIAVLNTLSLLDPRSDPPLPIHAVSLSALSAIASWLFIVIRL